MTGTENRLESKLEQIHLDAIESLEMAEALANEAAAAELLRRRMKMIVQTCGECLMESGEVQVRREDSSRQSTEESIRLAFSGIYFH